MPKLYVVGLGPGGGDTMTIKAAKALEDSEVIVGYSAYIELVRKDFPHREYVVSGMGQEEERCRLCLERSRRGERVALVCSGDPGVYGMASPLLLMAEEYPDCDIEVVSGVTAATAGAALLGAPLGHDFCVISLSDILTPWDYIENRLRMAAMGDFAIALYNPSSRNRPDHLKRACRILLEHIPKDRVCGLVRNAGRTGEAMQVCTLGSLGDMQADMFTTVYVGNSMSVLSGGRMIAMRNQMQGGV